MKVDQLLEARYASKEPIKQQFSLYDPRREKYPYASKHEDNVIVSWATKLMPSATFDTFEQARQYLDMIQERLDQKIVNTRNANQNQQYINIFVRGREASNNFRIIKIVQQYA